MLTGHESTRGARGSRRSTTSGCASAPWTAPGWKPRRITARPANSTGANSSGARTLTTRTRGGKPPPFFLCLKRKAFMKIIHGDCLEELKKLDDNSVDAVITDPPYGLSNTKPAQVADVLAAWVTGDTVSVPAKRGGFMGKDWDSFVPPPAVWEECMRVLKPGGHMAVFAGARTQDLMGLSIRLAGFEIRDTLGWVYGSGFPKSHSIGKA